MNIKWLTTRSQQLQTPWYLEKHIKYMSSIFSQNFNFIDDDHKEILFSKEIDFKTEAETLDTWIFFIHIQMTWNLFHIYIPLLFLRSQSCKSQNAQIKEIWRKKPDLTQSFQKLINLPKHILFFWNFENISVLYSSIIFQNFIVRSFHSRSKYRFKILTFTTFDMLISFRFFFFFLFTFFPFLVSLLHLTKSYDIIKDSQALALKIF